MIERALEYTTLICSFPVALFGGLAFLVYFMSLKEHRRKLRIAQHVEDWGSEICRELIRRKVGIDMTEEMVLLAWGQPTNKEFKQQTRNIERYRWTYKTPKGDTARVWITNGVVSKIEM